MKEAPEERSRIMRSVKGQDTAPEMIVRRIAFQMGYRFRLHRKDLPGKPDLVFPKLHKVIFVHGCFWHGHDCVRGAREPKTNVTYWRAKILRNRTRDAMSMEALKAKGWRVTIVWECELKRSVSERVRSRLVKFLGSSAAEGERRRKP